MTKRQTFGDKMVTLKNQRHEKFALLVAEGKTADEAYRVAGYKPNRGNATTLKANQSVAARVATIQAEAAVKTEITVVGITNRLMVIADKGEKLADSAGLSVARLSLMDAAKTIAADHRTI